MRGCRTQRGLVEGGRPGFSFVEILFAIMLLGVGFILFAAMLPTAVIQTQASVDQTVAVQIAKGASEALEDVATDKTFPVTLNGWGSAVPRVWSIADRAVMNGTSSLDAGIVPWQRIKGKMISAVDPRYAWTAVYSRERKSSSEPSASFIQVFIVVTRITTRDRYTEADLTGNLPNLRPREVDVYLTEGTVGNTPGPDIAFFDKVYTPGPFNGIDTPSAVAEGTFVIISDDQQLGQFKSGPTSSYFKDVAGIGNGRIYRVGNRRADLGPNRWELLPGYDMLYGRGAGGPGRDKIFNTDDDDQNLPVIAGDRNSKPARALIVGRASVNPSDARAFEGPAQDVALFSTYIPVSPLNK